MTKNVRKKWMAPILSLLIAIGSIGIDGFSFSVLADTLENVHHIQTAEDLAGINNALSGNYILDQDIDLTNSQWASIGSESNPFTGTFDGNGHTISNLTISSFLNSTSYFGLFGYVKNGTVKNLHLSKCSIYLILDTDEQDVFLRAGGIAGMMEGGEITGCSVSGEVAVYGYQNAWVRSGLLAGENVGARFSNCDVEGSAVSGISGVKNCMSGLICAWTNNNGLIENCTVKGIVNADGNYGKSVNGIAYAGGICGSGESGLIRNCTVKSGTVVYSNLYKDIISRFIQYESCTVEDNVEAKAEDETADDDTYRSNLDDWVNSDVTYKSMLYLTDNNNFTNSVLVHKWRGDPLNPVVGTITNMYFGGYDGWKEIFSQETSKDKAREILLALLQVNEDEVKYLSEFKTANKYAGIICDTFKKSNWLAAYKWGLTSDEIKKLNGYFVRDNIRDKLLKGKYQDILDDFKYDGFLGPDPNIQKVRNCVDVFLKSQELCNTISKGSFLLGVGLKAISIDADTVQRMVDAESLKESDDMYVKMLDILVKNCPYSPVADAAIDLKTVIEGGEAEAENYIHQSLRNSGEELTVTVIKKVASKCIDILPYGKIVRESYEFGTELSNIIFNSDDVQQAKENAQCAAYISETIAAELNQELTSYRAGNKDEKLAGSIAYFYSMLIDSRLEGEKALQNFIKSMDRGPLKPSKHNNAYRVSLLISNTLRMYDENFTYKGTTDFTVNSIACPVNVQVLDSNGTVILTLNDGETTEGSDDGIYWQTAQDPFTGEYIKTVLLPNNSNYMLKAVANDLGAVDYSSYAVGSTGTGLLKEVPNIPVKVNDVVEVDNISTDTHSCKLISEGSETKNYELADMSDQQVSADAITLDKDTISMNVNDKILLTAGTVPENATVQTFTWTSDNESVASVNSDGVVTGVGEGTATVTVESGDESGLKAYCTIHVIRAAEHSQGGYSRKQQMQKNANMLMLLLICGAFIFAVWRTKR